MLFNNLP